VTDWSGIEITRRRPQKRFVQDSLSILPDILFAWDFLACVIAGEVALELYAVHVIAAPLDSTASGPFWRDIVFGSLIASLILRMPREMLTGHLQSVGQLVLTAERRTFLAFFILIAVGMATRSTGDLARLWLTVWFLLFVVAVGLTRWILGSYLHRLGARGELREAVAIVGEAGLCEQMAVRISRDADVVGVFWTGTSGPAPIVNADEDLATLLELTRMGGVDSVIVTVGEGKNQDVSHLIEQLKAMPVQVAVCPQTEWAGKSSLETRLLGGIAMRVVADRPIKHWNLLIKTGMDKTGALVALLALFPLMVAIALAVASTSRGPVIFRQRRGGWSGRQFVILKFRTMIATDHPRNQQTRRGDSRCTPVGRVLRRCSLDELPQFWNVLRGDMSLVGPRPHAEVMHDIDRAGSEIVAEYAQRHRVKPGLTGWAQVNGARGATTSTAQLRRRVMYDLYYIENWSLWLDVKIIARTPFCLIGGDAF
jgi:Undecaprenyl-phosphate glucose phosphotransferase